jgi:hypothetical protein
MLGNPKLRKASSLGIAAIGAFTILAPKKAAVLGDKLTLSPMYENVNDVDLVPRDWYVDATRASGAGMLAAGLTGFLLATRDDTATTTRDDDGDDGDDGDDPEDGVDVIESDSALDDGDDSPVEIDLDDVDDVEDDD